MNQQPDRLFRDKLHGHQRPTSPELWQKVAVNIHKSTSRTLSLWPKVAATIVVLITAGTLLYPVVTNEVPKVASENDRPITDKNSTTATEDTSTLTPPPATVPEVQAQSSRKVDPIADNTKSGMSTKMLQPSAPDAEPALEVESPAPAIAAENQTQPSSTEENPNQVIRARRTVTIVFQAEEVNEKYLQMPGEVHATSRQKESSTLKNLVDKAVDLKHNQDPLGELRQKKDQILAMNFLRDKQRTESE